MDRPVPGLADRQKFRQSYEPQISLAALTVINLIR